jgi:hypothetical protein
MFSYTCIASLYWLLFSYCQVCGYRSFCDRGISAGSMDEINSFDDASDDLFSHLEIDQIGEISF